MQLQPVAFMSWPRVKETQFTPNFNRLGVQRSLPAMFPCSAEVQPLTTVLTGKLSKKAVLLISGHGLNFHSRQKSAPPALEEEARSTPGIP